MNKNETIADIRKEAEARFRELLEKHVDSLMHIQAMQQFNHAFDRIEAAEKRERDKLTYSFDPTKAGKSEAPDPSSYAMEGLQADPNWREICEKCHDGEEPPDCEYFGEPNGCNSPIYGQHPKTSGGDPSILRSALVNILLEMEDMCGIENGCKYKFSPDAIAQQCRDALALFTNSPENENSGTDNVTPVNNAACREALDEILETINKWRTDNVMEHWQYSQLWDIADAALAEPPRNCDVGTPEEQEKRFSKFCGSNADPTDIDGWACDRRCPLYENHPKCKEAWEQMPYKEGGEA